MFCNGCATSSIVIYVIFDLHNDFPTVLQQSGYSEYLARCKNTVTAAIWTSELDNAEAFVNSVAASLIGCGAPVAIEDLSFLCGKDYSEFDFSRFLYCSLTWNNKNGFAGGALDDGALTADGRAVIQAMNGKCALDLAHIGKRAFYEALDAAQNPICSHTGFSAHPRCLDENQISALVGRNAPIGLCAVTKFTNAHTAKQLAEVIDRFVQRHGGECLCIGSDFYGSDDLPDDLRDYSDYDAVKHELNRLGYTDADTDKIFYLNAKRFCKEIHYEGYL